MSDVRSEPGPLLLFEDESLAGQMTSWLLEAAQQHPRELMARIADLMEQERLAVSFVDAETIQVRDFTTNELVLPPTRVPSLRGRTRPQ